MTMNARYAIYFKPALLHPLSIFAAAVIGYEPEGGEVRAFHPELPSMPGWAEAVAEPQRYGFHATLKAPFRLAGNWTEDDLIENCDALARMQTAVTLDLQIAPLGNFIALTPSCANPALDRFAAECVRQFDQFRAPMTEQERDRRRPHLLTPRQRDYIERYGYPYVMQDFRFHMTLTGPLDEQARQRLVPMLQALHAPLRGPVCVNSIAIFKQATTSSQFTVLHRAEFPKS